MFKNLKVRGKLLLAFGIIIFLYIITVTSSIFAIQSVYGGLKDFHALSYTLTDQALRVQNNLSQIEGSVCKQLLIPDPATREKLEKDIQAYESDCDTGMQEIEAIYLGNADLLNNLKNAISSAKELRLKGANMLNAGQTAEAMAVLQNEFNPALEKVNTYMQQMLDYADDSAELYLSQGKRIQTNSTRTMVGLAVASLLLTVWLTSLLAKSLVDPIQEIEAAIREVARGHMKSVQVSYESKDELGSLAEDLRFVLTTLSSYVERISGLLLKMADGDLTSSLDGEYLGEWASIQDSANHIVDQFNDTLGQLNQSAEQVSGGSEQVSSGSQALSQGATQQASAVEELAATINDISVQVKDTAQNASEIGALIVSTGGQLNNCNAQMEKMMEAMNRINESSNQISRIIKTMEDIASQTNILALNAAVEAARVGAAGKGFAVVADEVRDLASKSAEATKNTTALIEESLRMVEEGNLLADATQESLLKVVEGASKISAGMEKITQATESQASSIEQITLGIDQISSVVQTNSATAEESAASSEELSSQASVLKSLVDRFRLRLGASSLRYEFLPESKDDFFSL